MTTADILRCAAAEIRDRGLAKHNFTDKYVTGNIATCPICAAGAINVAAGHDPDSWYTDDVGDALLRFATHLKLSFNGDGPADPESDPDGYGDAMLAIAAWNDAAERTAAEVVDALEAAAESLAVAS